MGIGNGSLHSALSCIRNSRKDGEIWFVASPSDQVRNVAWRASLGFPIRGKYRGETDGWGLTDESLCVLDFHSSTLMKGTFYFGTVKYIVFY